MTPPETPKLNSTCSGCGEPLPANAPMGLCPRCLLKGGTAESDEIILPVEVGAAIESLESPGSLVGRYKLLQKIGEGGFGVVYMAEQQEPVVRKVAIKIIKFGMDTKQVVARFEAESQALALMDHPNISKVLDAGSTNTGRPYFVMELVRGVPITEYCDKNKLSAPKRLELFLSVCQAVQHAHQKGIIHRDLKPSNIMVTLHDGEPVPKVIDFGIAKATNQKLTEKTLFTNFAQMIGTPAYMSPEQAEMSGLDVDTRTDIYSLGVLLYELLTGTTPFASKDLLSMGYGEMQKIIVEEAPPKPSTRLSTMEHEERTFVAKNRSVDVSRLRWFFEPEMDWMVMKALEKDRTRRYETANALKLDVECYLNNEAVTAAAPSVLYKFRKFAQRNKFALATATMVTMALIVSLGLSAVSYAREREARIEAVEAQLEAENRRKEAERNQYTTEINRISSLYEEGSIALALDLLEKHRTSFGNRFEWKYFHRLCQQGDSLFTFKGHDAAVSALAVSEQGVIASGDADGACCLIDIETGKEIARFTISTEIKDLAFTSTGQVLAVLQKSNQITLWDMQSMVEIAKYQFPHHDQSIAAIEFSPNRNTLLITPNRVHSPMQLWDWESSEVRAVPSEVAYGRNLAISPDGTLVSRFGPGPNFLTIAEATKSGSYETYAQLWAVHDDSLVDLVFSTPAAKFFATTDGWEIKIWDTAMAHQAYLLKRPIESVSVMRGHRRSKEFISLAFSPSGRFLASGNGNGTVTLWRGQPHWHSEETELVNLRGHAARVQALAYSHDGQFIVSGSTDRTVRIWQGDGHQDSGESVELEDSLHAVAIAPDGQTFAAGGFDGRVRLIDASTREVFFDKKLHENQVMDVAISPDGIWLASCEGGWRRSGNYGLAGRGISIVNLKNTKDRYYFDEVPVSVAAIDFSPDSRSLLIGDASGDIWLWDTQQRTTKKAVDMSGGMIWCIRYAPDGKTFAVGGKSRPLEIRDADSFELIAEAPSGICFDVDFDPSGNLVAFGQNSGKIRLFDASNMNELNSLTGHLSAPWGLAFLPDGKTLASGSLDRTVKLWNIETGNEIATLWGHRASIRSLAVSRDGNTVATSGDDKTLRLWHASTMADQSTENIAVPKD